MKIIWSILAQTDIGRLHHFLARHDRQTANAALDKLIAAPENLLEFPRRGSRLREFEPREVREFRIDLYVLRYELEDASIRILRIFHAREDRFRSLP